MCTAIALKQNSRFFGRNLDLEYHFNEQIVIAPRNFELKFRHTKPILTHYAFFGVATVIDGYPLYYDAANEHGLAIAGLNFTENAKFHAFDSNEYNIAQFEIIPFILSQSKSLTDAKTLLEKIALVCTPFNEKTSVSELHFFITDGINSLTAEPQDNKFMIYENPYGVLTNNPPFSFHKENINNYISLSSTSPKNAFSPDLPLKLYSKGMGAIGLPGDLSSASRFIRAAFTKSKALKKIKKTEELSQTFHILESVFQVEGCVNTNGFFEKTQYISVVNLDSLVYYYKTYDNSRVTGVKMKSEHFEKDELVKYHFRYKEDIFFEN